MMSAFLAVTTSPSNAPQLVRLLLLSWHANVVTISLDAALDVSLAGHDNGQVLLWRVDTCSHILLGPQAHSNSVSCLAPVVTAKGDEQLLSAGFDGCVCLWEPRQIRGVKPHLLTR